MRGVGGEPIAIVGIGCRFPQGDGVDAYWDLLLRGRSAIRDNPGDRWSVGQFYDEDPAVRGKSYCLRGGFLDSPGECDVRFFSLSDAEAQRSDPQHLMILEAAWEALESAAILPAALGGSGAGVFVGLSNSDFDRLWSRDFRRLDVMSVAGASYSVGANRLSYALDLRGPSVAIDAACASSLAAVHAACQSLVLGDCDVALSGGARLILSPEQTIAFADGKSLARGDAWSFDARASGTLWGEGCGMLVMKRLRDAQRDGDPIIAVISGSAVGHTGLANGLGAPSVQAQQDVIARAVSNAGLCPADIGLFEGHGSATLLGDAMEFKAIAAALSPGRNAEQICAIGSVKNNIGHLEAAAGVAGLIKVALAVAHGVIPPHLYRERSPLLKSEGTNFEFPKLARAWSGSGKRCAAVNAFSFGGALATIVVEEAPPPRKARPSAPPECLNVLVLSAQTPAALDRLAGRHAEWLAAATPDDATTFADVCLTAATARTHLSHRLAVLAKNRFDAARALREHAEGGKSDALHVGPQTRSAVSVGMLMRPEGDAGKCVDSERGLEAIHRECHEQVQAVATTELWLHSALRSRLELLISHVSAARWLATTGLPVSMFKVADAVGLAAAFAAGEAMTLAAAARWLICHYHVVAGAGVQAQRWRPAAITGDTAIVADLNDMPPDTALDQLRAWQLVPSVRSAPRARKLMLVDYAAADGIRLYTQPEETASVIVWNEATALHLLAEAYVSGAEIDWTRQLHHEGAERRRIPTYTFQRDFRTPALTANDAR